MSRKIFLVIATFVALGFGAALIFVPDIILRSAGATDLGGLTYLITRAQ